MDEESNVAIFDRLRTVNVGRGVRDAKAVARGRR